VLFTHFQVYEMKSVEFHEQDQKCNKRYYDGMSKLNANSRRKESVGDWKNDK
jgi:hypothetical protein